MMDRRQFLWGSAAFALGGLAPRLAVAAPAATALGAPVPLAADGFMAITPVVAPRDQGGYHAVWSGVEDIDTTPRSLWYARRFADDGTPATVLHSFDGDWAWTTVVALANGDALMFGAEGASLIGRSLTAAGLGARRVIIGSVGTDPVVQPMATRLADGNILVVWTQERVYGRILTSTMNPVGKAFLVSTGAGIQYAIGTALAPLSNGGAVVSLEIVRGDGLHRVVQRVRPGGGTVGPAIVPKRLVALRPEVTLLGVVGIPSGGFAMFWHGADQFGGHILTNDGTTTAQIATISSPFDSYALSIPAAYGNGNLVVAPATSGLTVAAFDATTGQPVVPFTPLSSEIGDAIGLERLADGTFAASTFYADGENPLQGWVQRFQIAG